ncbi:glycosyltransferase family 29 protein [Ideonella margarita]|uniref:Glycosyltransferase family 29 protein n=1 Tax=Ideonella margarita TaxID=2984191 RepID=A0ABU9C503_9BURK
MSWRSVWGRWQAWRHRQAGHYNANTLRLFWRVWLDDRQPAALVRLALFRRDLGRPLPQRWVAGVVAALPDLPPALRHRAIGLLAEVAPHRLAGLKPAWLQAASALPGVAAALPTSSLLCGASPVQSSPAAFAAWLASQANVMVVGNAASLRGSGLGAAIDAHAAVVRFNHWQQADAPASDIGARCDVWVVSPGHQGPVPAGLRWAIVSGPDVAFQVRRWPLLDELQAAGVPVLTVPLPVWRGLVAELSAPPSAGVLALAWMQALRPTGWQGMSVAGVGVGGERGAAAAHHIVRSGERRVGQRHDWPAEAALLVAWQAQGLLRLQ